MTWTEMNFLRQFLKKKPSEVSRSKVTLVGNTETRLEFLIQLLFQLIYATSDSLHPQ